MRINGKTCQPTLLYLEQKGKEGYLPIRNIFVPQTVQMPWVAGLPFFIVTFFSSFMLLFDLHLTQ
jgi:hypothetical protein